MLTNYLKATLRHLSKNKVNFVFKLGGLTMALLSFLIITIYVAFQLSFDKYHEDYSSVYRINSIRDENGKLETYAMVPPAIGPSLKSEFPEVKGFTRISEASRLLIKYNENLVRIRGFVNADNSLFDVLTFRFIAGDKRAIDRPGTVILTSSIAEQLFGTEDPIGKTISFPEKNNKSLEVTAIIEDLPANTHLSISAIMPFNAFENAESMNSNWKINWDGSVFLYVKLDTQANPDLFNVKMQALIKKNIAKHEDGREKNFSIFIQPINEIYLSTNLKMEFFKKGNGLYVYVFSLLGFFLLVIACINYINLSIADFHNRGKEIGIRKILGAQKKQIAIQITIESLFYGCSALLISLVVLYIIFPHVTALLDPNLSVYMLLDPSVISILIVTVLLIVVFTTSYSAIKLSINKPINDLKKELVFGRNLSVGKVLLLTQFVISIICIAVTLVVSNQVDFIETKDLGFDRTNVISLVMPEEYPAEKVEVLKNELKNLARVEDVSYSYYLVTGGPYLKDWYKVEIENTMKQVQLNEVFIDHGFFKTMGIDILAGRGFDIKNSTDSKTAFIVNETAAREFGWNDPIGKRISYGYGETTGEKWEGTVVGLAEDFNTLSLHDKIEPLVMRLQYDSWPGMFLNIKVKGETNEALASIKSAYEKVLPGYLMDYKLVEEVYDDQYQEETKALRSLQFGTWIVLLISSFGIFSLSLFMSIKRMKEFGIRKVLGATVRQIAFLHISYFLRIAIIASLIALPVSYWLTEQWLSGFAYRIEPGALIFVIVTLILLLLIILSSAYSAFKASRMNPVDAIKIE
jgi:putative ABC transport system permease protein